MRNARTRRTSHPLQFLFWQSWNCTSDVILYLLQFIHDLHSSRLTQFSFFCKTFFSSHVGFGQQNIIIQFLLTMNRNLFCPIMRFFFLFFVSFDFYWTFTFLIIQLWFEIFRVLFKLRFNIGFLFNILIIAQLASEFATIL